MLKYFNPWILRDTNILIGGEFDLRNKKVVWRDYSKKKWRRQQEKIISKILSFSALSSPLIMVPLINLFSKGKYSSPLIDMLGGKSIFWLLTILLGILVSQSVTYRVYMINSEVDVYDGELPIIVQKNIISNDINTRLRHNQATNGLIGSIFSKIPYLQWIIVMPILIVFLLGAYFAVNDSDSNLSGHLFFYIIFVILVATTIGFIQVIFSMTFIIIKLEKKMDLNITQLNSEQLQVELNKAEDFYKRHKVSHAAIKRYLAEHNKLLEEKEKEMQK